MENKNDERLFCKPLVSGSAFFSAFDLKKATKITLFEKFCLAFIKKKYQVDEVENNTLVYKIFRGKIYILNHFMHPPKQWNCRHSFVRR